MSGFAKGDSVSETKADCAISVIIPALNEAARIGVTVAGLAGLPGVEVVVVDGGSSDATRALAQTAGARVIDSAAGRGIQQNAGARVARGRIVLFLHADTRLPEGFAGMAAQALAQPGVVAGAFRLGIAAPGLALRLVELTANLRARLLPYGDQALFLAAETFRACGGFREIPLLEDVDLVFRLRGLGRVVLLPAAVTTSARRWLRLGVMRTFMVNQLVLLGFFLGIGPGRLAGWYRSGLGKGDGRQAGEQVVGEALILDKADKE
ncbi:MAG: TIGR04283 family arsenosugar biosynthesis glycosyltransferase [Thermodesulfobacteriota bacterium]